VSHRQVSDDRLPITGRIGPCIDSPPHLAAKADLARIETVRLHVAIQAARFEPSRRRGLGAAMAAAYANAVGGGAVSALPLKHVP